MNPSGDTPFHLSRGETDLVQQSSLTCGSAALTVARMLVSPPFARWIVDGLDPQGGPTDWRSQQDRFAEHEGVVMRRTNGGRGGKGQELRWSMPWPHALGTPPWGAARELEDGAARPGAAYAMRLVRLGSTGGLQGMYRELVARVRVGLPALLYIGDTWLPRHVTLVLPSESLSRHGLDGVGLDGAAVNGAGVNGAGGAGPLDVYDPATGSVTELAQERFASRALGIAGWNVPWIAVRPRLR